MTGTIPVPFSTPVSFITLPYPQVTGDTADSPIILRTLTSKPDPSFQDEVNDISSTNNDISARVEESGRFLLVDLKSGAIIFNVGGFASEVE